MAIDYKNPEHRLIAARCRVMDRDIALGDVLCRYVFEADTLDRVATMSRQRSKIAFNASWVKSSEMAVIVETLTGLAKRAATRSSS